MKLIKSCNVESNEWSNSGYEVPKYDREEIKKATMTDPTWLHFGAGNIFRAFPAAVLDNLLQSGKYHKGVIAAEAFDTQIISSVYEPYDNLSILVTLKADGTVGKKVVGSVVESIEADTKELQAWNRLVQIFRAKSLQMVSFTITEKGYALKDSAGEFLQVVQKDFKAGPSKPKHMMGVLTSLMYERYQNGEAPIALVSMDNCSHNGDKLCAAVWEYADQWYQNGFLKGGFLDYIKDTKKVSYPLSMIDKITPRPDSKVEAVLEKDGVEDSKIFVTEKNTYVAPFVCAEEAQYLVIEDKFPNGRPPLDMGGVYFTTREVVDKVEKMKVCACLNPLHTALAVFGCLLSHTLICDEMKDEELKTLVTRMGHEEEMPVVINPGIINPVDFLETVLTKRLPNPYMPDTPQRIASDTSQKIPIRFGEAIKAYQAKGTDLNTLVCIPLVLAGFARYLMGINDDLENFTQSPDPLLDELKSTVANIQIGSSEKGILADYLKRSDIFGVDLVQAGLADKVEEMFISMIQGKGAVRTTLHQYLF